MSITQQNGVCAAILEGLDTILSGSFAAKENITPIAFQALYDPDNLRGATVQQLGAGDQGHRKSVRIAYKQRALPSSIGNSKTCDSGEEKPYLEDVFDVNLHAEHIITITEATVRTLCDAHSRYISIPMASRNSDGVAQSAKQVMAEIVMDLLLDLDPMRQYVNQTFLAALALNFGNYVGGATTKNFNVFSGSDFDRKGLGELRQEFRKVGMPGKPILVGGGNLDKFMMDLGFGCCNDGGFDFGKMAANAPFKFYSDYDMDAELNSENTFFAFFPKTVQMAVFNKYVGEFARPIGTMERGTLPDPYIPGLVYDIRIKPNECDEKYDIYVNLDYDFWFAPDQFQTGDRLEGVTGVFQGEATNS